MTIGERIKSRREEIGMSQEELAQLCGYSSRTTIAKIEKGENNLRQTKVNQFAQALLCDPLWLIGMDSRLDSAVSAEATKDFDLISDYKKLYPNEQEAVDSLIRTFLHQHTNI